MLFGLTGAHRSGKSTTAKRVADELGITFYSTSTSQVARDLGFDPVAPMTLKERARLQYGLLNHHLEMIDKLPRPLIVDRTPLDMLGYMMAEFHMSSHLVTDPETIDAASRFQDLCLKATALNYDLLFYLCPLDNYVVEEGKPAPNTAFQRHHALLVQGGLSEMKDQVAICLIDSTDLEFRCNFLHDTIVNRMDEIETMKKTMALN